ncbi:UDP-GlcNAc:betaGal beta-1,3-N-acetylglucosaminyltransferase-like protein 1 isoform X5 [Chroicocephalus ridibundus]|uniref:UDP-GlcNAc:betaGal beta-1,3-N-acetylglucosaminyltransferase-like protein 1 isoform X5 n=1 Tax=Chroicocephalus ridibundus TaxID=1192867 RepID=UPI002FDC8795
MAEAGRAGGSPAVQVDDVMMPQRVRLQHEAAIQHPNSIIGCQVRREPPESTERYTRWINNLTEEQLLTQVFTSHGPTVIMPTWFCSREWFFHVGKFDEGGKGVPEDLLFFYKHIQKGGEVFRVNHCLLLYRYHPQAATHSVLEGTIWNHRVRFLEERVLSSWTSFTIWNAGKQGKKLYRSLSPANRKKVTAFCDVDEKKITKGFYTYEESEERPKPKIPICHFRAATPPFIICVKLWCPIPCYHLRHHRKGKKERKLINICVQSIGSVKPSGKRKGIGGSREAAAVLRVPLQNRVCWTLLFSSTAFRS